MKYHAVGTTCGLDLSSLHLSLDKKEIVQILTRKGFEVFNDDVDIIHTARTCIGHAKYKRGARIDEAPEAVDCSSFTKWLYSYLGIELPRLSIQQREAGEIVQIDKAQSLDLIFSTGKNSFFDRDLCDDVGHVGTITNQQSVIHASNQEAGVVETPIRLFAHTSKLRGLRRFIPDPNQFIVVHCKLASDIETSDDLYWRIRQALREEERIAQSIQ